MTIEDIAAVCHAANRQFRLGLGDEPGPTWDEADDDLRESAIAGVAGVIRIPGLTPSWSHQGWLCYKYEHGWRPGPVLDREKKIHPNLVPFEELSKEEQAKDVLFLTIVRALRPLLD